MRQQFVTLLLLLLDCCVAFTAVPTPINSRVISFRLTSATSLTVNAKKRRRRKSDDTSPTGSSDELPDFDIDDPEEAPVSENKRSTPKSPPSTSSSANNQVIRKTTDGEEITAAMMGTAGAPTKSVRDLLNDRSLERKLSFDDSEDAEELPDLIQMTRRSTASATSTPQEGTGKKKAKQAARQAAAAARQQQDEEGASVDSLLKSIPFFLNEKGQVSGVKILEAGTWTGIALLVLWEIYINSPLFDRAAPMAPVVY